MEYNEEQTPPDIELTADQVRTLIMLEHTREQLQAQLQGIHLVTQRELVHLGVQPDPNQPEFLLPYNLDPSARKLLYTPRRQEITLATR